MKNMQFNNDEINMINLFNVIERNKTSIEENNLIVVASHKFVKELVKKYYCNAIKKDKKKYLLISTIDKRTDTHYSVKFEVINKGLTKTYKLASIYSNNPDFENIYKEPDHRNDINVLYFSSKLEKRVPQSIK